MSGGLVGYPSLVQMLVLSGQLGSCACELVWEEAKPFDRLVAADFAHLLGHQQSASEKNAS